MKKFFNLIIGKFFWINIATAVVLVVLLCVGLVKWLEAYTSHGESVLVPKITGLYQEEAELLLRELDLGYEVVDSVHIRTMKPGEIAEQTPPSGSFVKQNRKIYITVNARTARKVSFKDYRGESYRKARSNYRNLGFVVDSVRFVPSEYSGELVDVECNGKILKLGDKINEAATLVLIVGRTGIEKDVIMPDVQGLQYDAAVKLLRDSAMMIGAVNYDDNVLNDEDKQLYFVYGQEPSSGTVVQAGKRVDIYLSKDKNKQFVATRSQEDEEDFF